MLLQYLMINSLYNAPITPAFPLAVARPANPALQAELGATDSITQLVGSQKSTGYTQDEQGAQALKEAGVANLNRNDSQGQVEVDGSTDAPNKMRAESNVTLLLKQADPAENFVPDVQPNQMEMFNSGAQQELGNAGRTTTVFARRGPHVQAQPRPGLASGSNSAMQQLKKERFLMRGKIVLENAWLVNQELLLEKQADNADQMTGIR